MKFSGDIMPNELWGSCYTIIIKVTWNEKKDLEFGKDSIGKRECRKSLVIEQVDKMVITNIENVNRHMIKLQIGEGTLG